MAVDGLLVAFLDFAASKKASFIKIRNLKSIYQPEAVLSILQVSAIYIGVISQGRHIPLRCFEDGCCH